MRAGRQAKTPQVARRLCAVTSYFSKQGGMGRNGTPRRGICWRQSRRVRATRACRRACRKIVVSPRTRHMRYPTPATTPADTPLLPGQVDWLASPHLLGVSLRPDARHHVVPCGVKAMTNGKGARIWVQRGCLIKSGRAGPGQAASAHTLDRLEERWR